MQHLNGGNATPMIGMQHSFSLEMSYLCCHILKHRQEMKATEMPIFFTDSNAMVFVIVVAVVFSGAVVFLMFHDYRLYLDCHRQEKFRLRDFFKREQFYVYLLIFFILMIGVELWMQAQV